MRASATNGAPSHSDAQQIIAAARNRAPLGRRDPFINPPQQSQQEYRAMTFSALKRSFPAHADLDNSLQNKGSRARVSKWSKSMRTIHTRAIRTLTLAPPSPSGRAAGGEGAQPETPSSRRIPMADKRTYFTGTPKSPCMSRHIE